MFCFAALADTTKGTIVTDLVNAAKTAVKTTKYHFIASLATVSPDCPLQLWCYFLPQVELTLNLLRTSPKIRQFQPGRTSMDHSTTIGHRSHRLAHLLSSTKIQANAEHGPCTAPMHTTWGLRWSTTEINNSGSQQHNASAAQGHNQYILPTATYLRFQKLIRR